MECTALVIYEDWHKLLMKQQQEMILRCHGVTMSEEQLERLNERVDIWIDRIGRTKEVINKAADAIRRLLDKLSNLWKSTLHFVVDNLKKVFDNSNLVLTLTKHNKKYNHLHIKQYFVKTWYYKNQFKLVKMHICIANHVKR